MIELNLIVYDVEVFAYDWLVVFKDHETGHKTEIHNDNEAAKACIDGAAVYCGFNNKHYDQFIMKAICLGCTPQEIKALNDYIIGGGQGWDYQLIKDNYFYFANTDIKDDMQMGLSLKAIEGHLGQSVQESTVPFDIDRPLTEEEIRETFFYCGHDVDMTDQLLTIRKNYLKSKINIGRLAGIDDVKALSMTNAKLTAALLQATRQPHTDEREYKYPDNLLREFIPPEVFEFFDRMKDTTVDDKELFSAKIELSIGECPVTIGYGGIHGAVPNFFWDSETSETVIRNFDVASYYPHLMTICGYTSRNIPSPEIFSEVLERRMKAKAAGDTATANALKLVVNTTYGAMLNQYNDLYDPLMGRSVCITGQLFLLELAEHLHRDIPDLRVVQLNTDGIMIEFAETWAGKVKEIVDEWQSRTGFELEEDSIVKIAQKDVNNYVEVQNGGKAKAKGGYLVRGIAPAGAFNINNNACIVATALTQYFVNGTPVEETINSCTDIFQFQLIAKAGMKYREAYHLVDGVKQPVQRVNRVYATKDQRYGKLFKVKAENDSTAKIEMLPEHCIIDNDNQLSIDDVDRQFYIDMAKKRINDFLGIKPEKKSRRKNTMATASTTKKAETAPMNVYQRLLTARAKFLEADVQKTGKNMHLSFKYFELDDIVPPATRIFTEVGLVPLVNFTADTATMTVVNTDNPEDTIVFTAPFNQIAPIVSNAGKQATNEMQALGSSITYMRRYLYMMALDICENDGIDGSLGADTPAPAPAPKAPPATPEQREEVKNELTNPEGNATPLQIRQLKNALKKLKTARPDKEEYIAQIAVQTKGFTVISKEDCEKILTGVSKLLAPAEEGGEKE
nr:MAG TPA: DNA polymerase [Caudoviricetes sp.]